MAPMDVRVIITNAGRDAHLPACLHYLGAAGRAGGHRLDVYLVEPDNLAPARVDAPPAELRLHRVRGPGHAGAFGKAALLNAGIAALAPGWDCCALLDADLLVRPDLLDLLGPALRAGYVVVEGRALDAAQTRDALMRRPPYAELAVLRCEPFTSPAQIAFTRGWLGRYGEVFGYPTLFDERFVGAGYQDTVPDVAASLLARAGLAGKAVLKDAWLHLDHPRAHEPALRERNLALACALHDDHRERLRAYLRRHGPPRRALPLLDEAAGLLQAGRGAEAEATIRAALTLEPDATDALQLLAVALGRRGAAEEAVELLARAAARDRGDPSLQVNLGEALRRVGRRAEARVALERALALYPYFPEAHLNLGVLCRQEGNDAEAAAHFGQAARLRPGYTAAHYNLGNALRDLGRPELAMHAFAAAISARPGYAEAHLNLGAAFSALNRRAEALSQYSRAAMLGPGLAAAHRNLAKGYEQQGRLDAAGAAGRRALAIAPDDDLLRLSLDTLVPQVAASTAAIDAGRLGLAHTLARWSARGVRLDRASAVESGGAPPFPLIYQGRDDRPLREAYAALLAPAFPDEPPRPGKGPPRLGFVVTEGHEGVFLKCMAGLVEGLPSGELRVGVACGVRAAAGIRAAIRRPDLDLVPLPPRLDRAAAALREARFDVLVFWEVGTDNLNYLLPFCRCAPVQCAHWGWPVTTGIPAVTHFLSAAPLEPPGAGAHYSERLVPLPSLPTCYRRPPVPTTPPPRSRYGLRDDDTIYLCAQNLRKVHPDFDALVASILRGDPRGRVIFLADGEPLVTAALKARLEAAMPDVAGRVGFLPRMAEAGYLGLVAVSDLLLDTLHYGGGANTCLDAAAVGRPVVTLPGAFHRGRWALAIAEALGVRDGVADSPRAYVERALALGADRGYRAQVSARVSAGAAALFDRPEPARELAEFVLTTAAR